MPPSPYRITIQNLRIRDPRVQDVASNGRPSGPKVPYPRGADGPSRCAARVAHLAGGGTPSARRILVTTGVIDDLPAIAGVRERWGRDVLHCPYCHGWEVRDQPLGVLGTHPGAVMHAQLIRQWSDDVLFFAHTTGASAAERAQLDARGIRVVVGFVVEDDRLTAVALADGRVVARTAVFIRPHNLPRPGGLLSGLGVGVDAEGFVVVDRDGGTNAPGVWAAGNVVDGRASVIAAAGAAATAAMAVNADLVREDLAGHPVL